MANVKCTNLTIVKVPDDPSRMLARWKCGAEHKDHFELVWHYSPNGTFWVEGGRSTVNFPNMLNGWYNETISLPAADICHYVRFNVIPVSTNKTETYYSGNTKKTRTVKWWSGELVTSAKFVSALYSSNATAYNKWKGVFDKAYSAMYSSRDAGSTAYDQAKWTTAVSKYQEAQKRADEAVSALSKMDSYNDVVTDAGTWSDETIEKKKQECEKVSEACKNMEDKATSNLSDKDKATKLSGEVANAKSCTVYGNNYDKDRANWVNQGDYGMAATYAEMAQEEFESTAWWYGKAAGNAPDEATEKMYSDLQSLYSSRASEEGKLADSYRARIDEIATRPEPPSASFEQSGAKTTIDIECASKWSDTIWIYRDLDGDGEWGLWNTLTRTVPKDGGAWNATRIVDSTPAGHSYRYCFRTGWSDDNGTPASDRSAIYGPFAAMPSQPVNLAAKLAGEDSVTLTWEQTGKTGDSYEVQYSSWFVEDNAWVKNAVNEIKTMTIQGSAEQATVSGLDAGKKWYFRVKRINAAGSAWAIIVGGEEKNYKTVSCNVPATPVAKLARPTGLKAEKKTDTSVLLTWTDALEADAHYEIEHSTNANAWRDNAVGDIETEQYDNPGGQYRSKSFAYTVVNLEQGKKHYLRVVKRTDTQQAIAQPAVHESKVSDYMVFCALPAPTASIAAPTNAKATKNSDDSIKVSWTSAQDYGDSFEIWYTDSSTAFSDNAMGDISSADYDEYTTSTSKVYTVTQLERGRTWYFKVRRVTSAGAGAWSVVASCKLAAETLNKPTGLKAEKTGKGQVTLTWTDAMESGASYTAMSTQNKDAYSLNAQGDIDEENVTGASSSSTAKAYTYTLTGLTEGKTYYIRLRKDKDALSVLAGAGAGTTKYDSLTAYIHLDVTASPYVEPPIDLVAEKRTDDSIRLTWVESIDLDDYEPDSYDVQYTSDANAFTDNAMGAITSETAEWNGDYDQVYSITGLERGCTWYVRVRKVAYDEVTPHSEWSYADGVWLEPEVEPTEELYAPTCADTLRAYPLDGTLIPLSWTHNSSENSDQSAYQLEVNVEKPDGTVIPRVINGQTAISYGIDPDSWGLDDGSSVEWRVRTCGAVEDAWSPWSRTQVFNVFANPVAGITLKNGDWEDVDVDNPLTLFPLRAHVTATSANGDSLGSMNLPIEYAFEIASIDGYETTADDGTRVYISPGQVMYSATIDANSEDFDPSGWHIEIHAQDVQLSGGQSYQAKAWVLTSQGLRGESEPSAFTPLWDGDMPQPSCSIVFDQDDYTCRLTPQVNLPEEGETLPARCGIEPYFWLQPSEDYWVECGDNWLDQEVSDGWAIAPTGEFTVGERENIKEGSYYSFHLEARGPIDFSVEDMQFEPVSAGWSLSELHLEPSERADIWVDLVCVEEGRESIRFNVGAPFGEEVQGDLRLSLFELGAYMTPEEQEAFGVYAIGTILPESGGDNSFSLVDDPSVDSSGALLRPKTYIDVYRVESDGSTVEVATGMPNDGQARAIDPHPDFGTCTYRVVAHDEDTELSSSCDFTVETKVPYIVVQWDEKWEGYSEDGQPEYGGCRLELLCDQTRNEEYAHDAVLREYAGRKHPVSYYGTQKGQSASMSADLIHGMEGEQLALARRLAAYPGDVYVREPGGTGYWANANVSISHSYDSTAVPVSLEFRRVEHD